MTRCTEYEAAVGDRRRLVVEGQGNGARRRPYLHLISSQSRAAAWTLCGRVLTALDAVLVGTAAVDAIDCRSCREVHLRIKRSLRPGWWAKKLTEPREGVA